MSKAKKGTPNKKSSSSSRSKASSRRSGGGRSRTENLLRQNILAFLQEHNDQEYTPKQIAQGTGLWEGLNNTKVRSILDRLADEGAVEYIDKGRYKYLSQHHYLSGKLDVTKSGVGFLLSEDPAKPDIFVPARSLGKAMHGDTVKVRMTRRRQGEGRPEGEVVEVLERNKLEFVGIVEESLPGSFFLLPDDPRINTDFFILPTHRKGAVAGEKVLVKMVNWDRRSPEVEVISVLGKAGDHHTEMHAILLQYGFDPSFPAEVEAQAEAIPVEIPKEEYASRRDFRDTLTFTIDPFDAKDFDDALSLQRLDNGHWEVGIHIADVSYYVQPGTAMDREAFRRATSVYLVDRTVPMLPEKLSNMVCSLRPHEDKLTYSAVFELDEAGKFYHYWIGRTIIHSDHRFTYEEAQEVLEGTSPGPFAEELQVMDRIAKKLRAQRMLTGAIEFHSSEVKFELDENDKPVRVIKKVSKDANKLIEDFMLLANRTVSAHIANLEKNPPLPSVYRIHDRPDPEKLASLQTFVKAFGHQSNLDAVDVAEALNRLLHAVEGQPEQNVIESLAIRSMAKAVYSTQNLGHFGLGFKFYTHFTSPIRRYPDLMIHRLLTKYHQKQFNENPTTLEEQCKHWSKQERTAAEAERASIKYKQVEFMQDKIGEVFEGLISGVIESGFFVELKDSMVEGMVPVHTMQDDYYVFDQEKYALIGRSNKEILRLGDSILVEIAGTDMARRTIDMKFIEKLTGA